MPLFRAPEFWRGPRPKPAAQLLRPLGGVYGAVAAARLMRKAPRAPVPAIVVGGPCLGGDGKTPLALAVAAALERRGRRPFFITRGYGGAAHGAPFRVDPASDARLVGDEALLLAAQAPTILSADRLAAARLAAESGADVVVLDDGLHSRRLAPDLALLAFDSDYGVGNGLCFPAGPLRAPLAALAPRVDAIVAIGDGPAQPPFDAPVFRARAVLNAQDAAALAGRRVLGFCAIARGEKFRRSLIAAGADVVGFRAFADHRRLSRRALERLEREAARLGAALATTEKDAARLGALAPRFRLRLSAAFDDSAAFCALLTEALGGRA